MKTVEPHHDFVTTPAPSPRPGHIGRLTAVTMGLGAVAAVVLAVVVFGGATEPVITGVVLLAFAASWWMYAVLSARRTDQPQRWAQVPAVVMAVLGAASLLLRPSADAMSAVGWVWPVGLLALAVWMTVQSRRSLHSWSRRAVLYPIFALMIVGSFGGAYETVREAQDRSTYAMPGQLVDVGGHRLHISCTGTGSPTVVLEGGLGEPATMMAGWIAPAVATTTRVCVYDRAGRGWSDPAPGSEDGLAVVTDLHTLLERHGEVGPFVIAGHSSGGVYAQAYAATYPDEVAGLVLLDSQPPEALTRLPDYATFYAGFRKATGLMPSVSRFGLMRLISASVAGSLPGHLRAEERAFLSTASHNRSLRDEFLALPAAMARARTLTTLGAKPLVVVTAEKGAQAGWLPLQDELARLSTNSDHRVLPDATHASLTEDETEAAVSSRAITDVVQAVRSHGRVPSIDRPSTPVDELVAVGGARLHVRCEGSGDVTVVLISGFLDSGDKWSAVTPTVSRRARVCSYARFGDGTSDPPPATQSFVTEAEDLRAALRSIDEPGPYVVVGHSFGGAEAATFTAQDPTEVVGLVLLDASPVDWLTASCAVPDDGSPSARIFRDNCASISSPGRNAEHLDGPTAFAEAATIDSLGRVPLTVITAARHPYPGLATSEEARLNQVWDAGQQRWASLSSSARIVSVENTSHDIQLDRPDVVIDQIQRLLP